MSRWPGSASDLSTTNQDNLPPSGVLCYPAVGQVGRSGEPRELLSGAVVFSPLAMPTKHEIEHRPERPVIGLVNWQRIPDCLRELDQWVLWQYRWSNSRGCWTKVPRYRIPDAHPGCRYRDASSVDPATWHTFEDIRKICDHWEVVSPGRVGVGFVLTAADPFVMLDWDDARDRDTGVIVPTVADLLRNLDSYTEISPSETGLKSLLLGAKPGPRCKDGLLPVEIYEARRFVALTGDTLQWLSQDIEGRQSQLTDLYTRCFPPPPPRPPAPDMGYIPRSCPELPDDEMLQAARLARNGDRFAALWAGDSSGYRSRSEGDFALAFRLAFWTRGDAARVENLMWQSGRVREKWHRRSNYVRDTVAKAVAQQTHHYGDGRGPDRLAEELAGIDPSMVVERGPAAASPEATLTDTATARQAATGAALAPPSSQYPPILPLTTPCETDADLAQLLRRSYYDHDRYFCPRVQRHMLEDRRTGNPIEILKRCGKCPACIRRRIDAILARVRHQLADLDRRGVAYFECISPHACWEALRKRMQRAAGDSLRYHRLACPHENYIINTAGEGIQTTAEHVLHELEARLREHFHGPRVFYSCRAWEEVNLADHEKHCDYRFPVDEIDATTVHEIAAAVGAYIDIQVPRDDTGDTQAVRIFKRAGGWSNEQLAHFYAMIRAGEVLPDSSILDYDPADHSPARNGGRVHAPGAASHFSQDNSG